MVMLIQSSPDFALSLSRFLTNVQKKGQTIFYLHANPSIETLELNLIN